MAPQRKQRSSKSGNSEKWSDQNPENYEESISENTPVWYLSDAPLGSAVKYVASLSSRFNWVGIYILKGKFLELGPYIGAKSEHTRIPVGKGVCGSAVSEDRDLNIPNVKVHENYLACSIETRSELVVLVRDQNGKVLGQIDIDSHFEDAFGPMEENLVRQVAQELGKLWPV